MLEENINYHTGFRSTYTDSRLLMIHRTSEYYTLQGIFRTIKNEFLTNANIIIINIFDGYISILKNRYGLNGIYHSKFDNKNDVLLNIRHREEAIRIYCGEILKHNITLKEF